MRVTAREVASSVTEDPVRPGRTTSALNESVRLEIARPTRLGSWRPESAVRGATENPSVDPTRDLGPARGMVTAVGLGVALWMAIILVVRTVVA